jgi:hypothetical protein
MVYFKPLALNYLRLIKKHGFLFHGTILTAQFCFVYLFIYSFNTLCPLFGDFDDHYLLSFDIVLSGRYFLTFQRNLCYPSSKQMNHSL